MINSWSLLDVIRLPKQTFGIYQLDALSRVMTSIKRESSCPRQTHMAKQQR